jgi:hypothetical protein
LPQREHRLRRLVRLERRCRVCLVPLRPVVSTGMWFLIKLRLAPPATAPYIAHPPLPPALRWSGRTVRSLRLPVALNGLLHLFVDLPQSHAAWAF